MVGMNNGTRYGSASECRSITITPELEADYKRNFNFKNIS